MMKQSELEACVGADALVLLTEWPEFAAIEPYDVATRMKSARVVDSQNILDKTDWIEVEFVHRGVGR